MVFVKESRAFILMQVFLQLRKNIFSALLSKKIFIGFSSGCLILYVFDKVFKIYFGLLIFCQKTG